MATTFAKLRDGSWGVTSTEVLNEGDRVQVTRKDGSTVPGTVGRVIHVDRATGRTLATFIADAKPSTSAAPAPQRRTGRFGWVPCGYPGCRPAHCDECDGAGGAVGSNW